ncbi:MAG: hypothetical protein GWO24_03670, partial [Akkermansiaceae bacterium]|nr:hypothetical protein [Akkermansiaceae bacterium]
EGLPVVNCEKRTRAEDAQPISLPAIVRGVSANLGAHHYRFRASAGQTVVIFAEARESDFDGVLTIRSAESGQRLCQADDHEVHGADPWLEFVAPGP